MHSYNRSWLTVAELAIINADLNTLRQLELQHVTLVTNNYHISVNYILLNWIKAFPNNQQQNDCSQTSLKHEIKCICNERSGVINISSDESFAIKQISVN